VIEAFGWALLWTHDFSLCGYLSPKYIDQKLIGSQIKASSAKWIGKYNIISKQDGGRHLSNLESVRGISFFICSKSSIYKHLAYSTLKNIDNSMSGSHISLGRRRRNASERRHYKRMWQSWLLRPEILHYFRFTQWEMLDENLSGTFKSIINLHKTSI